MILDIPSSVELLWTNSFTKVQERIIEQAPSVEEYFMNDLKNETISLVEYAFDLSLESISFASNMMNNISKCNLTECKRLKSINCGDNCGKYIMDFVLNDMPFLETIVIGNKSFTQCPDRFNKSERKFHVSKCPMLTTISMGSNSFTDCSDFYLNGT